MKQSDKIIMYLDRFGSITALDALRDLSVMRLAARIGELKEQGYNIKSTLESDVNRFGDKIKYARYEWA